METGFPDGDTATITLTMPTAEGVHARDAPPELGRRRLHGESERRGGRRSRRSRQPARRRGRRTQHGRTTIACRSRARSSSSSARGRRGDTVELTLPKSVRLEPTPDNKPVAAIMWGPLVLAGDLGPRREGRGDGAPMRRFRCSSRRIVRSTNGSCPRARPGDFRAHRVSRACRRNRRRRADVSLTPFYRTHRRTLQRLLRRAHAAEFDARVAALAAERERVRRMEAATRRLRAAGRDAAGARLQLSERAGGSSGRPHERPRQSRRHRLVLVRSRPSIAVDGRRPSSSPTSTSSAFHRRSAISTSRSTARLGHSSRTRTRPVSSTRATPCPLTS